MQTKIRKPVSVLLSLVMVLSVFAGLNVLPAAQAADAPAYLTFTGTDSFSIEANSKGWDGRLEYSTNGDTWNTWDGSAIDSAGNVLYLRGTGNTKISGNSSKRWIISAAGTVACSGDIRTLLKYEDPDAAVMANYCFSYLFYNCTSLTAAPELPATTLASSCYSYMFEDCTGLTAAPELPATTLANSCYRNMFEDCTGLTAPPELPATTLAEDCYASMFFRCTGLTAAPELPATTLADFCYASMFEGCEGLTAAPELPTTTLANYCYFYMFNGCTGLTAAPELPATTLASACYRYMFSGCTGLTAAPELPATTLADDCYQGMFHGCTGLTAAPELPATTLANYCYYSMFKGCTGIKLSTVQKDEYNTPYRIPTEGEGTAANYALDNMFAGTGGTFTGTPSLNTIYYVPHVHRFTYVADGASVTAACGEGCSITEGLRLTISAPTGELVYDGETPYPAALSTGYNTTAFPGEYAITYTKNGEAFTGTPVEAGAYTASVTVGTATASVSYTVAKADPNANVPTGLTALCGYTLDSVTLPDGWTWDGADETTLVGEAGQRTFSAAFTPADPDNYEKVTENLTVTVFERIAENEPTCEEDGNYTYYVCGDGKYYTRNADDAFVEIDQADTVRPATDHDYRFDSFVWADDNTAKAKYVCTRCGEGDPNHTAEYAAEVTSAFTAATCGADAYTVYTATYDGHTGDKTVTQEGTATGNHVYGTTGDARFTCTGCGQVDDERKAAAEAADQLAADKAAFNTYKTAAKAAAGDKIEDGDSAACRRLILNAKNAITALTYDESKTPDENKAAVDAILAKLDTDLAAQREADAATAAEEETPCPLCGGKHGRGTIGRLIRVIHRVIALIKDIYGMIEKIAA